MAAQGTEFRRCTLIKVVDIVNKTNVLTRVKLFSAISILHLDRMKAAKHLVTDKYTPGEKPDTGDS